MCPNAYYDHMRESKDSRLGRLRLVQYAQAHGVKPTARRFGTTPPTVRKWLRRYDGTLASLQDYSHAPKRPQRRLRPSDVQRILELKRQYPHWGAERLKREYQLPYAPATIRKVARAHGLQASRRRRKHVTKNYLRHVKRQWALFQQSEVDTKYLYDIPEYWPQMNTLGLPRYQYTFREVTTGLLFVGYGRECCATYAVLFLQRINAHLLACGADLSQATIQTDNGVEFVGSWQARGDSAFTQAVERVPGQKHRTIPPGAHRWQADVETVHNLMEVEFFELEQFQNRQHFLQKVTIYQHWFNCTRKNSGKEHRTPWDLLHEKAPTLTSQILNLPPVLLDELFLAQQNHDRGGYDVCIAP